MTYQKGVDVLIDCIARLKHSHPQMRFALVGDGPLEQDMRALAKEKDVLSHLTFVGRVDGPYLYLRAADMMLLTSRWEALPITIVESFQSATPVVATSCSGVVELVDDTVGACVSIGNIDEICEAVIAVTENKGSLKLMSDAAFERSKEDRFDPDWVHQQFEKTYRDLIAKGRG
jgi:glycosyltransferase involved in cell wall biosynthesis